MAQSYAKYIYFDDGGKKHPIRMSPGDAAAQTTPATQGAYDSNISAVRSRNAKQLGLKPRYLRLSRSLTGGTGGTAVTKTIYDTLPILLLADFQAFNAGATVSVSGTTWNIIGKVGEHQA